MVELTSRRVGSCFVLALLAGFAGCGTNSPARSDGGPIDHGGTGGNIGTDGAAGGNDGAGGSSDTGGSAGGSIGDGGAGVGGGGGVGGVGGVGSGGTGTGGTGGRGGSAGGGGTVGTGGRGGAAGAGGAGGGVACTVAGTCPAPVGGNGMAACTNGACRIVCNTGYHLCGNVCAINTSPATCGTASCTPCVVPANATATCGGTPLACGVNCTTGYHACGGNSCVVDGSTSITSCGNTCTVCTAPANGSVTCSAAGACVRACATGFHLCGTGTAATCVANNSVASSCGATSCTACTAPPNGTPICGGNPLGCSVTCDAGFHTCNNNSCVANSSVASGCTANGCTACIDPANGTPVCNGTTCGVACSAGFHPCGGNSCVVNGSTNINSCGNTCTVCTAPANGNVTCNAAGACVRACNTGFHLCSGLCVSNNASLTCGTRDGLDCDPCPAGSACTNATCGIVCGAGTHTCPLITGCFANDSITQCGTVAACTPCAASSDPNAEPVCTNNQCGFACKPNFHRCPALTGPCVSNNATATCGTSCTACPEPTPATDGTAVCIAPPAPATTQVCDVLCDLPGFCKRGTPAAPTCVPNNTVAACGTSCATCPAPPANGTMTCSGSTLGCVRACDATFHLCPDNTCASVNDDTRCGAACTPCTGATPNCMDNVCVP